MKELDMAKELIRWRDLNMHRYPCLEDFYHIPNEGKRALWIAKVIGIKAGVSDYHMPVSCTEYCDEDGTPIHQYHGFWIELKSTGQCPTREQLEWISRRKIYHNYAIWTDSLQVAIDTLEWYCKGVEQ